MKTETNPADGVTDLFMVIKHLGELGFISILVGHKLFHLGVNFSKATLFVLEFG